jgi:hypothetical protein
VTGHDRRGPAHGPGFLAFAARAHPGFRRTPPLRHDHREHGDHRHPDDHPASVPAALLILREQSWFDAFAGAASSYCWRWSERGRGSGRAARPGYAAFFAIGAYTYAYRIPPYSGTDAVPAVLVVGAAVAAVFGSRSVLNPAPPWRLPGDHDLGFGEIVPIVFLNLEPWTEGTNGSADLQAGACAHGPFSALTPFAYFILDARDLTIASDPALPVAGLRWAEPERDREDELAAAATGSTR